MVELSLCDRHSPAAGEILLDKEQVLPHKNMPAESDAILLEQALSENLVPEKASDRVVIENLLHDSIRFLERQSPGRRLF